VLIFVIGSLIILSELGIDLAPILTTVGILGLAFSFGAQSLVKDVISGVFILMENKIRIGDIVEIAGKTGTVEDIKIRTVILRDLEGIVHVIPNGSIDVFSNRTMLYSSSIVDIGVAYKENVDDVIAVLRDEGERIAADPEYAESLDGPVEILGIQELADSGVIIRTLIRTVPAMQWSIAREFRRRIKNRFDAEGIEIPFPHRTIFIRQDEPLITVNEKTSGKTDSA
jgi:small conductance mechanosensitive channel